MSSKSYLWLTIGLLSATLAGAVWSDHRSPEVLGKPLSSIPTQLDGWIARGDLTLRDRIAASLDATSYLSRIYRRSGVEIDVFAAFYARQKAGESMHSPKYCLPGGGWEFADFRTVDLTGTAARINRAVIQKPGDRKLMFYWYQSRTRVVTSEYQSKIFLVWDGLVHDNPGGSIVRIVVPDRPEIEAQGMVFARWLFEQVQSCFRSPGAGHSN